MLRQYPPFLNRLLAAGNPLEFRNQDRFAVPIQLSKEIHGLAPEGCRWSGSHAMNLGNRLVPRQATHSYRKASTGSSRAARQAG